MKPAVSPAAKGEKPAESFCKDSNTEKRVELRRILYAIAVPSPARNPPGVDARLRNVETVPPEGAPGTCRRALTMSMGLERRQAPAAASPPVMALADSRKELPLILQARACVQGRVAKGADLAGSVKESIHCAMVYG
eukprot:338043-Prymnesium_polylepis.3